MITLTPDEWRRAHAIAERAAGLDSGALRGFLDVECADLPDAVRSAVIDLLERCRSIQQDRAAHPPRIPRDWSDLVDHATLIGRGATGAVWKARQRFPERWVAIKVLHDELHADPQDIARFVREANAVAKLGDEHIVSLLDAGVYQGRRCLVFEHLGGGNLEDLVRRYGLLEPRRASELVECIAHAVATAHAAGFVHRDIKPGNILLDEREHPKLADFGLVKRIDGTTHLTLSDAVVGTPGFMAPEQASGLAERVGPPTDVYGLGAVLYFLVTGRPPFTATNTATAITHILHDEPAAPRSINPDVPYALETICLKCLRKSPSDRYESAQTLADDLRRFRLGECIQAVPPSLSQCIGSWVGRHKILSVILTAATLWMGTVSIGSVILWRKNLELDKALGDVKTERDAARSAQLRATEQAHIARAEALSAHQHRHVDRMVMAQQALESGQKHRAIDLLEAAFVGPGETDLRGFEWGCLWQLVHSELTALQGHEGIVNSVAFSPDGKHLASSSWDSTIRVWNVGDGRELLTIQTGDPRPYVAWSPDGTQLAGGLYKVAVWDSKNGALRRRMPEIIHKGIVCISFSHDGSLVAAGRRDETGSKNHIITLNDVSTGALSGELSGHTGPVRCLAFSPDNSTIVSGAEDQRIIVWSLASKTQLRVFDAHFGVVSGVAFSPDGRTLASASWDGTLRLWDTTSWERKAIYSPKAGALRAVSFLHDGDTVVTAGEGREIVFVNVKTGDRVGSSFSHPDMVWSLSVSPDGKRLASSGGQPRISDDVTAGGAGGLIRLWDINERKSAEPARRWADRAQKMRAPTWTNSLAQLPKQWLIAAMDDGKLQMWRWEGGNLKLQTSRAGHTGPARSIVEIPQRALFASGGMDGQLRLWHSDDVTPSEPPCDHGSEIIKLAAAPDGQFVLTSAFDHRIIRWEVDSRTPKWSINVGAEPVHCLAVSPDGRLFASGDRSGAVQLRSTADGQIHTGFHHHQGRVTSVAFSPDGQWLLSGSVDRTTCLQKLFAGPKIFRLRGHHDEVQSAVFTPDGNRVVTGSWDGTAKIWDTATGLDLLTLRGAAHPLGPLAVTSDGQRLVVSVHEYRGVRRGLLLIWQAAEPEEIWNDVLQRHPLEQATHDPEMTLVRAAWTLAHQRHRLGEVTDAQRRAWLEVSHRALLNRLKSVPDDRRAIEWQTAFADVLR